MIFGFQKEITSNYEIALKTIEEISSALPVKLNKELIENSTEDSVLRGIIRDEFKLYCKLHDLIVEHLEDLKKNLMGENGFQTLPIIQTIN